MRKAPAKKTLEKRKKPRRSPATSSKSDNPNVCRSCSKDLRNKEKALFVEEEVGRIFCSETCITDFFTPEIDRLEREYFRWATEDDLSNRERAKYAHLRWLTLQEPDEVWREKTLAGDSRFSFISEFQPGSKRIWSVCICLCLRGEPSFLYLAFTTQNPALANRYRRGERIEWAQAKNSAGETEIVSQPENPKGLIDGLADEWTEDETLRAKLTQERRPDDIPFSEFSQYQSCFEETLDTPDELWSQTATEDIHVYHFIKHYAAEPDMWYVIIAKETENEEEIEIVDAFPTRDSDLVDRYRTGEMEIGSAAESPPASRIVH